MSRSNDDLRAGLVFIAIAVFFAVTAARTLQVGTVSMMGPGFFPLLVSVALAMLVMVFGSN